jgi:hypothetical protein
MVSSEPLRGLVDTFTGLGQASDSGRGISPLASEVTWRTHRPRSKRDGMPPARGILHLVRRPLAVLIAAVSVVLSVHCASPRRPPAPLGLVLLTRQGCVLTDLMRTRLDTALRTLRRPPDYAVVDADLLPHSDPWRGLATPTILVGNRELFGVSGTPPEIRLPSEFEPT